MELCIDHTWDGDCITHAPVKIVLSDKENGINISISSPYFGDPLPDQPSGQSTWFLWDYEVVEMFFLNSSTGEYLELEFGPHGHYLGILFKKRREFWKKHLMMNYSSTVEGTRWTGSVVIPWDYLPEGTDKYNAYAIHGTDNNRVYEALFPVPKKEFTEPDYHRLEYFEDIPMKSLFPHGKWTKESDSIWKEAFSSSQGSLLLS